MNFPCENCISFAICNSFVKKCCLYTTYYIMAKLCERCTLFNDWFYNNDAYTSNIQNAFETICNEFDKSYNIEQPSDDKYPMDYIKEE